MNDTLDKLLDPICKKIVKIYTKNYISPHKRKL